jgi:hypothetical protein
MNDAPTSAAASHGPWRILLLDRDPADPKWIITTVPDSGDVRPAEPGDDAPDEVTAAWVSARHGQGPARLTPLPRALAWRGDEK